MKVLIVEDEKFARENLERLLKEIQADIEILEKLDSVSSTVEWLKKNKADLIFLDIHLADDLSFNIFNQVEVETPIIFTTAYDQYALQAFKVNSVDYLLKPIDQEELSVAIDKFQKTQVAADIDYQQLVQTLKEAQDKSYQERFIVSRGEKIMSVTIDQIA
ncbi:MAG: response regulator, partial [Bacteroidota bacterium]